jgi:hypothetical protein
VRSITAVHIDEYLEQRGVNSMVNTIWGVDSASSVTNALLQCVRTNYGSPRFWGRYIKTVPGAADGLTRAEIALIHGQGIRILPVYSDFRDARGYSKGQVAARNAIHNAKLLGIPKNVVLFANVERFFAVDEAWIRGWVDTLFPSDYKPGFYNDPVVGGFSDAFCKAAAGHDRVRIQSVLWSAEPHPGVSKEREAPAYAPTAPPCRPNVWAWQ